MKHELKWTEEPPTEAGWYWNRHAISGARIIHVDPLSHRPRHWKELKAEALEICEPRTSEFLRLRPDEEWKIEWAGPIPVPTPENEDSLVRQTVNLIKDT